MINKEPRSYSNKKNGVLQTLQAIQSFVFSFFLRKIQQNRLLSSFKTKPWTTFVIGLTWYLLHKGLLQEDTHQ